PRHRPENEWRLVRFLVLSRCRARVRVKRKGDADGLRKPVKIAPLPLGKLLFAAPRGVAPGVKPLPAVVIFELKPRQSAGDFLAVAAGKRVQPYGRITSPPEAQSSRPRLLLEEVAHLAVIALASVPRSVVVGGEVEVVRLGTSQQSVHAHKLGLPRKHAG